jgi:hypothetical protein
MGTPGTGRGFFLTEERQYAPFVVLAIFFGLVIGFPLGLTIAHSAAQSSDLGGRLPRLVQLHGHIQLAAWFGLFVMGMGYRLLPRFTSVPVVSPWLPPATLVLATGGLALRAVSQPFATGAPFDALFALSAVLEAAAAAIFTFTVLRCVRLGKPDEFGYKPFFAAGAVSFFTAMLLNLYIVADAATDSRATVLPGRSTIVAFLLLYGFVSMFVFAISLRVFPVFFGRPRPSRRLTRGVFAVLATGVILFAASALWATYERTDFLTYGQDAGLLITGAAILAVIGVVGIFRGAPHRLRPSAQRNMRFIRSAYFWLAFAATLQSLYAVDAMLDDRVVRALQVDAARHFIALGFLTTVLVGMAFLVLPRLAVRRLHRSVPVVTAVLLALLHGATAFRGAGSIIADRTHLEAGYWSMTAGGTFAVIAIAVFTGYILYNPRILPEETVELHDVRHRRGP